MIMSFSVPENNPKYALLIDWYQKADRQERSREFREIFLTYLGKPRHTIELQARNHVSRPEPVELVRVDINRPDNDDDLDSRLDIIGTSLD